MLIISSWFGRTGNNIFQIIRAIHYAFLHNHKSIHFNKHELLKCNKILIELDESCCINNSSISDTFYYLDKYNIKDPEPYVMKCYFQKYIKPIFFNYEMKIGSYDSNLYIHIRSGDIFSGSPHKLYVQPPLFFYNKIKKDYTNIKIVAQDKMNPCINELLKHSNTQLVHNDLKNDLIILSNASNLVIGFGTFGLLIYFMNKNLKNLYIPKYVSDYFINGTNWGKNINVFIIDLPNYIKPGEWQNTQKQRNIMLSYNY